MTANRASVLAAAVMLAPLLAAGSPPAELLGRYLSLNGDRIEFAEAGSGSNDGVTILYSYKVLDGLRASLSVDYPSSGRLREISLDFLADGTPAGYQEFDFISSGIPMPPIFRAGAFEIGELDVAPPITESTAPESLVGAFLSAGGRRFEFLTGANGRVFVPGQGDYFTYRYLRSGGGEAVVEIEFTDGLRSTDLALLFDEEAAPISCSAADWRGGDAVAESDGQFEIGVNRHLGDLKIGTNPASLLGDDHFNASGSRQTASQRVTKRGTVVYPFAIENDGDFDSFRLRATRGRRHFEVSYFTHPGRENVTAAIVADRYETAELGHREEAAFRMEITPLRARGAIVAHASSRSVLEESAHDLVKTRTRVNVRARPGAAKGRGGSVPGPASQGNSNSNRNGNRNRNRNGNGNGNGNGR